MTTWLWIVVVAVGAIALLAVLWWSSGRSSRRPVSTDQGTANQRFLRDTNAIATMRNRDGMGPGPL